MARNPVPLLVVALFAAPLPALAAEALSPPTRADGVTSATVLLRDEAFTADATIKARSDTAEVRSARVVGPGLVEVTLVAPARPAPGQDVVWVRGKNATGRFEVSARVPSVGGAPAPVRLTFGADAVAPGGPPVTVHIGLPATGQLAEARAVRLVASAGQLSPPESDGRGGLQATWTPPASAPGSSVVAIAALDPAGGGRVAGVAAVALQARKSLTLEVPPDSQNTLTTGSVTHGPAQASPAGTVAFELAVDPREARASLASTTPLGKTSVREIELPRANIATHVVLLPAPRFQADGRPVDVYVAALRPNGAPGDRSPTVEASTGTVQGVRATGVPGVWAVTWAPPTTPGRVTFTATIAGHPAEATAEILAASPAPTLVPASPALAHDADRLTVVVGPASRVAPGLGARGATVDPRPKEVADGWSFTARGTAGGVWLLADPVDGPTGGPLADVHAWATAADGADALPVTLLAVDAAGLPVADLPVTVAGDILDASSRTSADGLATVWIAPSDAPRPVDVTVGGLPRRVLVGGAGPTRDLSDWQARAPVAWVPRDGAPPVVLAAAPAPAAAPASASAPPPTASAPAAAPSPARASAPRPAAAAPPWLRIGLSAGLTGHTWTQDADDDIAGPDGESSSAGGLPAGLGGLGAGLHATAWFGDSPVGVELDAVGQRFDVSSDPSSTARLAANLRGRLRVGEAAALTALAGAASTPAWLVVFDSGDPEDETTVQQRVLGGEFGAGVQVATGRVFFDLTARELLAPWPVQTRADLTVGYAVADALSVDLQLDYATRTMAFEVDGESIDTTDALTYVGVGATFLAR